MTARLQGKHQELVKIKKMICQIQGHTYLVWECEDGTLDREWYYIRACGVCGKRETTTNKPKEYTEHIKQLYASKKRY